MLQPAQSPPVDRRYMRLVVGKKGKPQPKKGDAPPLKTASSDDDYLLELMTFHVRRAGGRGVW